MENFAEDDNATIEVLRKSRKAYIIEYSCTVILLFLLFTTYYKGIFLKSILQYFVVGLAATAFLSAELSRILTYYKITPKKVVIVKGIIKQNKKNVYFHPLGFVPDINVKQNRIQRILNYGTIYVKVSGQENSFEICDINRPQKIMNLIEDLISKNKHPERNKR